MPAVALTALRRWVAIPLTLVAAGLAGAPAHAQPAPGAPGAGDPLFPGLGNGGYDVDRYDVALTYPSREPRQTVSGTVSFVATATQALSSFNLDFSGSAVESVSVNGAAATWSRSGEELVVTPQVPLNDGRSFVVRVRYTSGPMPPNPEDPFPPGWLTTRDGSVTAAQPDRAHSILPVNDHPSDKASYSFRVDVPQGVTAVANGALVGRRDRAGRTLWAWVQRQPMASHLIQVAVGALDVIDRGSHAGVELRDVAPAVMKDWLEPALARTPDHLAWLESRVGGYPFEAYGILAADRSLFFALETQTLSLFSARDLDAFEVPAELYEPIMVHELAHQWFGDSVAVRRWSDLWLSEGHATWYEWEYASERFGFEFEEAMRETYAAGNQLRAQYGPVARPRSGEGFNLFNTNVYAGGALVLYALRQEVGDPVFREIERTWLREHRGEAAGTEDFVVLASEEAGRDLGPFLRQWLYETATPPMPGRPDWTVDPAEPVEPGASRVPIGPHAHTWLRRW